MEVKISNTKKKIELSDAVFGCEFNEALIHQVVTAYMAGGRAGTKAQKTRSQVSGGGVKPFKQKGTGRARAGTIRSPLWRTGGKVFAATPRSYKQKVNKKMFKGAMRSIFSELIRQERLQVIDAIKVDAPKTKSMVKTLHDLNIDGNRVMIVTNEVDENVYLSARNLPNLALADVVSTIADPVSLVSAEKVLVTEAAMKELEGLLQ